MLTFLHKLSIALPSSFLQTFNLTLWVEKPVISPPGLSRFGLHTSPQSKLVSASSLKDWAGHEFMFVRCHKNPECGY